MNYVYHRAKRDAYARSGFGAPAESSAKMAAPRSRLTYASRWLPRRPACLRFSRSFARPARESGRRSYTYGVSGDRITLRA
jgi:hypothetical protein